MSRLFLTLETTMTRDDKLDIVCTIALAIFVFVMFVKPFALAARAMFWLETGVWISTPGLFF